MGPLNVSRYRCAVNSASLGLKLPFSEPELLLPPFCFRDHSRGLVRIAAHKELELGLMEDEEESERFIQNQTFRGASANGVCSETFFR